MRADGGEGMTGSNQLEQILGPLARTFERHVLWAVRAILESDVAVKEPFRVSGEAPAGRTLYCLIPNSNSDYHAQLAIGLSMDDLPGLFPGELDPRLRLDALGEMGNVVAGLVMADEAFMGHFGHLKPSTPFFSEGAFTDRKDAGIRGTVTANGTDLAFHVTVRPAGPENWTHG
jgi:hypothetical protein